MSVKFRNPKTGEVFEVTDCCNDMFCKHIENCCDCPILTHRCASQCADYVNKNPHEAAELMGYEVVEEKQMPKINMSKFTDNYNIVVQCKTEEEAEMFCDELHNLGYFWCDNTSLKESTEWSVQSDLSCYFHSDIKGKSISIGMPEDVEENETLIQFADLLEEETKPRICEVLGLNVGEEFTVDDEDGVYHISSIGQVTTGVMLLNPRVLCDIINHPEKIKPVIKLSDNEMERIKAIKAIFPKTRYITKTTEGIKVDSFTGHIITLQDVDFPSLPMDKEFDITKF